MKIVHLSTYTAEGGAGIATLRIHKNLLERGIDSTLLVLKSSQLSTQGVQEIKKDFFFKLKDFLFYRLDNLLFRRQIRPDAHQFSFNSFKRTNIKNHPLIKDADIICLYWVGANFLTPKQIGQLKKPVIWRLSDMWPFTGGCHYSAGCRRYEEHCGRCPQLMTTKKKDFTWLLWRKKNKAWRNKNLTLIAPSNWIADAASKSSLFRDKRIERVGTGVDHNVFKPFNKQHARNSLNVPLNSKIILFGANNALESTYKGGIFFHKLIQRLIDDNFVFLIFGSDKRRTAGSIYENVKFLGVLKEEEELRRAYSAADIFICPSTEDNLPNTVLESMACGTPCIAFRGSGGVDDAIDHKHNGYMAEMKNVDDLINGIIWITEANVDGLVSLRAREKILNQFTLEQQVSSLLEIYHSVLKK